MSPMLLFKREEGSNKNNSLGELVLAIGASGGPKIITSVVQVIIHYLFLGMSLFDAMAHPRIHDQILYHESDVTCYESCHLESDSSNLVVLEVSNRTKTALRSRGHQLLGIDFSGVVQAVAVDLETGLLSAVSDIRKGGSPDGY
jgi:gamma-glutamyltranspeptidase